jgi:hypothetical protein
LTVAVDEIVVDDDLYPRMEIDQGRVAEFAELLAEDAAALPPIEAVLDEEQLVLADGRHRLEALRRLMISQVEIVVLKVPEALTPSQHVLLHAIDRAATASLPLNPADRKRARDLLLQQCPDMTFAEVARRCGMTRQSVSARAGELCPRPPALDRPGGQRSDDPVVLIGRLLEAWGTLVAIGMGDCGPLVAQIAEVKFGDEAAFVVAGLVYVVTRAREMLLESADRAVDLDGERP